jgi:hypothetical protein
MTDQQRIAERVARVVSPWPEMQSFIETVAAGGPRRIGGQTVIPGFLTTAN